MRRPRPIPGRSPPPFHVSIVSHPSPPPSGGHGFPALIWPSPGVPRRGSPLITQDAVQFASAVQVGSGRVVLACLIVRLVFSLPGIWDVAPWKRAGREMSRNASSTTWNSIPMYGVTCCTKAHSYWRDFCRPAYAVCGCRRATPSKVASESCQPSTLSPSQLSCAAFDPTNPPR